MIIDLDRHNLSLTIDSYMKQIKDLEKASGYKIDELIELFKQNRISSISEQTKVSED